jgi:hypothetical protein
MVPYVSAAISRISYIHPRLSLTLSDNRELRVAGEADVTVDAAKRDVAYTLYREKIFTETLEMRRRFVERVLTS